MIKPPARPHSLQFALRFGLRAGGRAESWLRFSAWPGNLPSPSERVDPCQRWDGLYCLSPDHAPGWITQQLSPQKLPIPVVGLDLRPWVESVVLPWAQKLLTLAPGLTADAANFSLERQGRPLGQRITLLVSAQFGTDAQGMIPRYLSLDLRETPRPMRSLLFIDRGWRTTPNYSPPTNPKARAETVWGQADNPVWRSSRSEMTFRYYRPLANLLLEIEQPAITGLRRP